MRTTSDSVWTITTLEICHFAGSILMAAFRQILSIKKLREHFFSFPSVLLEGGKDHGASPSRELSYTMRCIT